MKKTIVALIAVVALAAAYAVWPLWGMKELGDAVAARNASALAERLDTPRLKRSLVDQIGRTYLRVSGKDRGLSPLEMQIALRLAGAAAGPRVDDMLRPEALIKLLTHGGAGVYSQLGLSAPRLEGPNLHNLAGIIRNTEYSGRDFYIVLPLSASERTGYRIRLRLEDWTWKLAGIGLPEAMRLRIAEEIQKRVSG